MHPNPDSALPDGWPNTRRPLLMVLWTIGVTIVALAMLVGAVITAAAGEFATALFLAVAALFPVHLAGLAISLARRPRRSNRPPIQGVTDQGEKGLSFPYARGPYYWLTAILLLTALALAGFGIAAIAGGTVGSRVMGAICVLLVIFLLWFTVVLLRSAPGRIVLTPDGVYHRSMTFEHFVPWYAVYDVTVETENPAVAVKAHPADGTRLRRYSGRLGAYESQFLPFIVARAYWLGGNAVPAFEALRHYFTHPDERAELARTPPPEASWAVTRRILDQE